MFSDLRLKCDVQEISLHDAKKLLKVTPISFRYKKQAPEDEKVHLSFKAQDFIKYDIKHVCGLTGMPGEDPLEDQDIVCEDGRIFHLPSDARLTLNVLEIVPMLVTLVKDLYSEILYIKSNIHANDNCKRCKENGHSKKNDSDDII